MHYVNILDRNDLITALINELTIFRKGKQSLQACNYAKRMSALVNHFFSKIASIFKKCYI